MNQIRPAAVAGAFYPGNEQVLSRELDTLLTHAGSAQGPLPKALIVPHAGYIYSGPIAASAYRRLAAGRDQITRVVLLGPAHRVAVRGLALPQAEAFATPLGQVRIDQAACRALQDLPQVVESATAHALEHSLEVQLPFLQKVLGHFELVPLVVGDASAEEVAQVLERLWGGPETLILISSDLSHYLPYALAQRIDHKTSDMILHLQTGITHEQACGGTPVNGLLLAAKQHGLTPELLDLRNSGDTAGSPEQVVGYASFAFVAEERHVH
jgi:AmmeMemoRadiSam system protein B